MKDTIERLKKLDNVKLMDLVKNYRQYGYDDKLRASAIGILEERGISEEDLRWTGNFKNYKYDRAESLYGAFNHNSTIAFIFYCLVLVANLLIPILSHSSEGLGLFMVILSIGSLIAYLVFLIKSFYNQDQFYKAVGKVHEAEGALLYWLVGMPLYVIMYFYFRNRMKEKMKEIT